MDRLLPSQMRGARGMLGWSMLDLAKAAGVSISTVKRLEDGSAEIDSDRLSVSVQGAFEAAGIRFFLDEQTEAGLRLIRR